MHFFFASNSLLFDSVCRHSQRKLETDRFYVATRIILGDQIIPDEPEPEPERSGSQHAYSQQLSGRC